MHERAARQQRLFNLESKKDQPMKTFLLSTLMAIFITACNAQNTREDAGLTVIAHDIARVGDTVPVSIKYTGVMKTGDKLVITANDELVASYEFLDGFQANQVSLRARMKHSGSIAAKLLHDGAVLSSASKQVTVNSPAKIPKASVIDTRRKFVVEDNSVKLIIANGQSSSHYITRVDINTNVGRVLIIPTVLVSKYPYFSVKSLSRLDPDDIKVHMDILQKPEDIKRYRDLVASYGDQCNRLEHGLIDLEKMAVQYSSNTSVKSNSRAAKDALLMQKRLDDTQHSLHELCTSKKHFVQNANQFGMSAARFGSILDRRLEAEARSPLDSTTLESMGQRYTLISSQLVKLLAATADYRDAILALDAINRINKSQNHGSLIK